MVASIPSGTEYSPSLASRGSPLAEGAGRAADATGKRARPASGSPPSERGGGAKRRGEYSVRRPPRVQPVAGNLKSFPCGGVTALDAKRKNCLRIQPGLRVLFQRGDPAATRRCPRPLRAVRQEGPVSCTARSDRLRLIPFGPFHQSLQIFLLKFQHLFCKILVASTPSNTEYSPSLASRGSPLAEGAGRAADAPRKRARPAPGSPPSEGGRSAGGSTPCAARPAPGLASTRIRRELRAVTERFPTRPPGRPAPPGPSVPEPSVPPRPGAPAPSPCGRRESERECPDSPAARCDTPQGRPPHPSRRRPGRPVRRLRVGWVTPDFEA